MQQTLPKSKILRGYQSFSRVISSGTRLQGHYLTGYIIFRSTECSAVSFGFVVSKKRVPLAVKRNRIKRLMRESVRKNLLEVNQFAEDRKIELEVVLSYNGIKNQHYSIVRLEEFEKDWNLMREKIFQL